jgi:hypothetical protein
MALCQNIKYIQLFSPARNGTSKFGMAQPQGMEPEKSTFQK